MTYIHHLFETQDSQERRVHRMLVSHAEPVQRDRSHCKCQTCFAKDQCSDSRACSDCS